MDENAGHYLIQVRAIRLSHYPEEFVEFEIEEKSDRRFIWKLYNHNLGQEKGDTNN
jgi:hypothetical protein